MKTFAVSALLVGTASIAESSVYSFARSAANANYDLVMNAPNYVGDKGTDFGRWSAAKLSMEKPLREYKAWIDHMDEMTFSQKYMCTREKYKQAQELVWGALTEGANIIASSGCLDSFDNLKSTRCKKVDAEYTEYIDAKEAMLLFDYSEDVRDLFANDILEKKVWGPMGAKPSFARDRTRNMKAAASIKWNLGLMAITALTDWAMLKLSGWEMPHKGDCEYKGNCDEIIGVSIRQRCNANFDMGMLTTIKPPPYVPFDCNAWNAPTTACDRPNFNKCAADVDGGECRGVVDVQMEFGSGRRRSTNYPAPSCASTTSYSCACKGKASTYRNITEWKQISDVGKWTNHVCQRSGPGAKNRVVEYKPHGASASPNDAGGEFADAQCEFTIPSVDTCLPAAQALGYIIEEPATEVKSSTYPMGCFVTKDATGKPTAWYNSYMFFSNTSPYLPYMFEPSTGKFRRPDMFRNGCNSVVKKPVLGTGNAMFTDYTVGPDSVKAICVCSGLDPAPAPTPAPTPGPPPPVCLNFDLKAAYGPLGTNQYSAGSVMDKNQFLGNYAGLTSPGQPTCEASDSTETPDASRNDCRCPSPDEGTLEACGGKIGRATALNSPLYQNHVCGLPAPQGATVGWLYRGLTPPLYPCVRDWRYIIPGTIQAPRFYPNPGSIRFPRYVGTKTEYFCAMHPCTSGAHNCAGAYAPNNFLGDVANDENSRCVPKLNADGSLNAGPIETSFTCECRSGYAMDGTWTPALNEAPTYRCVTATPSPTPAPPTPAPTNPPTPVPTPKHVPCMSCIVDPKCYEGCKDCATVPGTPCPNVVASICTAPPGTSSDQDGCKGVAVEYVCTGRTLPTGKCTWGLPAWALVPGGQGFSSCPYGVCRDGVTTMSEGEEGKPPTPPPTTTTTTTTTPMVSTMAMGEEGGPVPTTNGAPAGYTGPAYQPNTYSATPVCSVDADGYMVMQYDSKLHPSFHCHITAKACDCTDPHPTHAATKCQQLTHSNGRKFTLGGTC